MANNPFLYPHGADADPKPAPAPLPAARPSCPDGISLRDRKAAERRAAEGATEQRDTTRKGR